MKFSTGDRVEAGFLTACGVIACGPFVFGLLFVVIAGILTLLPFGVPWPLTAAIAGILTVLLMLAVVVGKIEERKRKDLIAKAAEKIVEGNGKR